MAKKKAETKVKKKKTVEFALVFIQSTFNNTIVTISDEKGNAFCWASAGSVGFKGTKKGTPFAAQVAADTAAKRAISEFGTKAVSIFVKGAGSGRESAVRALQAAGLNIRAIKDMTPIPHNGCKPRKRRRV
jgi:small subunit ribosomal protein S11